MTPRAVQSVVRQLQAAGTSAILKAGGHDVPVSSLDKQLWPGHTKRDLLTYLASVSPWLLPHLAGRPVFVTRWPNGITGKSFYQKVWENPPAFVKSVSIWSKDNA